MTYLHFKKLNIFYIFSFSYRVSLIILIKNTQMGNKQNNKQMGIFFILNDISVLQ